jgi:hypothetical protein
MFRLSDKEKEVFERKGRHLRVNFTHGGCMDCDVFPSQEDEEPVRLCRQCFFDTHKLHKRQEEAFGGLSLPGAAAATPTKKPFGSPKRRSMRPYL